MFSRLWAMIINPFLLRREHRMMEEMRLANPGQQVYLLADHPNYKPR